MKLKPFREYSEHDVVNLFTVSCSFDNKRKEGPEYYEKQEREQFHKEIQKISVKARPATREDIEESQGTGKVSE